MEGSFDPPFCKHDLQLFLWWSDLSLNIIVNMEGILGGMMSRKHATFETFTMIWLVIEYHCEYGGYSGRYDVQKTCCSKDDCKAFTFVQGYIINFTYFLKQYFFTCLLSHLLIYPPIYSLTCDIYIFKLGAKKNLHVKIYPLTCVTLYVIYLHVGRRGIYMWKFDTVCYISIRWEQRKREDGSLFKS